jgi:regulator of protease activity HflC (stomatin/prohibitin superfamily)
MAQQFDPNQIDPEKLKEGFEKLKVPITLIALAFFFSGPLSSLITLFDFNMETIILVAVVVVLIASIKQINQYERGVKFTIGKFTGLMEPGWRLVIPIFQSYQKVDMRVRAVDVPDQEAITKDNISVTVNAVIYYKLSEAQKAILEVENVYYAVSQLAQTTMRNVVGEVELDELLSNRDAIAERIRDIVDKATDVWGVKVSSVELKDVTLPEDMKRVIGKQAEAERERRAVIIKAEGEVIAAENISKAAGILAQHEGSLHLRTLHSINDISSDQSNTVVFAVPLEVLRAFERMGKKE